MSVPWYQAKAELFRTLGQPAGRDRLLMQWRADGQNP
jgi:hypothetical protein